jgi:hypothetical protein
MACLFLKYDLGKATINTGFMLNVLAGPTVFFILI